MRESTFWRKNDADAFVTCLKRVWSSPSKRGQAWKLGVLILLALFGSGLLLHAEGQDQKSAYSPEKPVRYVDVAPAGKFDYKSNNDFTGRKYFPQPMCGGVAVSDFDGDGKQDIFFTNGAKLPEL
ncbi:MAG TPA: hypothetical protein VMY18_09385, partial [Acidobacteriota bacterium]|nr:hypothetical protein [Acidobacteriota bacterium]